MPARLSARLAALAAVFAVVLIAAGPLAAQSLDSLRASGAVGERFDGYAEARDSSAAALVKTVNAKRRQIYEQRAKAQGVSADQVGRVYAKEILEDAPGGTYFHQENGAWVKK
jgi:uncharacterized protein YdbL (DUF1318 family)